MPSRTDRDVKHDVLQELRWDTRVSETEVGITVRHGVVTLNGTVDSLAKKIAAQKAAHRVSGVLDVANDILVHVPQDRRRTDTEIAAAVRRALEWDAMVPHERIHSTVSQGFVTLEGDVRHLREKTDAEDVVLRLDGVHGVINRILVAGPAVEADDIRRSIEEALGRRAHRAIGRVKITVEGGRVTLSGNVDSWSEKRSILGLVSHSPGVREVADGLDIDPYGNGARS